MKISPFPPFFHFFPLIFAFFLSKSSYFFPSQPIHLQNEKYTPLVDAELYLEGEERHGQHHRAGAAVIGVIGEAHQEQDAQDQGGTRAEA